MAETIAVRRSPHLPVDLIHCRENDRAPGLPSDIHPGRHLDLRPRLGSRWQDRCLPTVLLDLSQRRKSKG